MATASPSNVYHEENERECGVPCKEKKKEETKGKRREKKKREARIPYKVAIGHAPWSRRSGNLEIADLCVSPMKRSR